MKGPKQRILNRRRYILVVSLTLASLFVAAQTRAATLTDKNSTINLNLNSSVVGMSDWIVDGGDQVNQQSFWYRIGSGPQLDLSSITTTPIITTLGTKQLTALYSNGVYGASISYTLTGSTLGTGHSALTESINFFNYQTNASLDLHFFMYSDFTLGGPAYAPFQNVVLGTNTSVQTAIGGLSSTVAFPFAGASHTEAAAYPFTYNRLTTVSNLTLNDSTNAGPGDITWAFEWDKLLAPSTSLGTISITDTLQVPEPSAAVLVVGGLGLGLILRRKSVK